MARSTGPPGASTARAASSALKTVAPCAWNRRVTRLLPVAMPPVMPTTGMDFGQGRSAAALTLEDFARPESGRLNPAAVGRKAPVAHAGGRERRFARGGVARQSRVARYRQAEARAVTLPTLAVARTMAGPTLAVRCSPDPSSQRAVGPTAAGTLSRTAPPPKRRRPSSQRAVGPTAAGFSLPRA